MLRCDVDRQIWMSGRALRARFGSVPVSGVVPGLSEPSPLNDQLHFCRTLYEGPGFILVGNAKFGYSGPTTKVEDLSYARADALQRHKRPETIRP